MYIVDHCLSFFFWSLHRLFFFDLRPPVTSLVSYLQGWWCLTPLSTIFQLYRGGQFYWWREPEYPKKRKNNRPAKSNWQNLSHNVVSSTLNGIQTHNVSGDRNWLHRLLQIQLPYHHDHDCPFCIFNKWFLINEKKILSQWMCCWAVIRI